MADTLDGLIAEFQDYVVSPLNAFGLGGFVFDVGGENSAHLSADITDHYTEDNKALQDHIAVRPKKLTLKGYVGELVYYGNADGDPSFLQSAVQKLTVISDFLPEMSSAATQIQQAIESPTNSDIELPDAANIYGLVQNLINSFGDQKNQQKAYTYFKALMNQKILMGVQTPWEFMTNMAIETITAIQPENSRTLSDFSITLKEIRIAKVLSVAYTDNPTTAPFADQISQFQPIAAQQAAPQVPLGPVPGVPLPSPSLPDAQQYMLKASDLLSNPAIRKQFEYQASPAH